MQVVVDDPYLSPHDSSINDRYQSFLAKVEEIEKAEGSLLEFARSYKKFGLHKTPDGFEYTEWAPGVQSLSIFGEFNDWKRWEFAGDKNRYGVWTVKIPNTESGNCLVPHDSLLKVAVVFKNGQEADRMPAWSTYLRQNVHNVQFNTVFWNPPPFVWRHPAPPTPKSLKIYECHIGMSSEEQTVASFEHFTDNILPKIVETGYNCVQIMAIQEHAYYASFGYHVTNFFATSGRYGPPDGLKRLIDTAHSMGIIVLMDLIHSHASSNVMDGISNWDGTNHHYFHEGQRGYHSQWDSRLFNYSHWEVLRFLLSNIAWWMEEFHFDGFRFDGITSMLYKHHGIRYSFSGQYHEYFDDHLVDLEAVRYLMLANHLIKTINPNAVIIAEDVSGFPTLCCSIEDGGIGFDYRLNMSIPDKWIQLLKEFKDDDWNMGNITYTLTNRRSKEKWVSYAESHDQCIVGDKTIAMWLFDKDIYTGMAIDTHCTPQIDRGMALHKMIRLISTLGGEAYLNFMGNEFGHPEWVDFPREGNNFSYWHCRRQWWLRDDIGLRYHNLWKFDAAMHATETKYPWLNEDHQYVTLAHEEDKIIVFEKGNLVFVFNFHVNKSFTDYRIGTKWPYEHITVIDSDSRDFHGHGRLQDGYTRPFPVVKDPWQNRPNWIQIYIPSRTAMVLRPLIEEEDRVSFGLDPVPPEPTPAVENLIVTEEAKTVVFGGKSS